ncbi:MAG: 6,7-dimethyl-8-ribityllumazine synthase [Verrucomicrobiales bacterium]
MLRTIAPREKSAAGMKFAIVAAKYNERFTDALVEAARQELEAANAASIDVIRVPGSFEVPAVAAKALQALESGTGYAAVICIGVIFQGHTSHAQHIAEGVTNALAHLQIISARPVIHAVLLFENEEQAVIRCLGKELNRGTEAARVAVEMGHVMNALS